MPLNEGIAAAIVRSVSGAVSPVIDSETLTPGAKSKRAQLPTIQHLGPRPRGPPDPAHAHGRTMSFNKGSKAPVRRMPNSLPRLDKAPAPAREPSPDAEHYTPRSKRVAITTITEGRLSDVGGDIQERAIRSSDDNFSIEALPPMNARVRQTAPSNIIGDDEVLEDQLGEAAFVICWPIERSTQHNSTSASTLTRGRDEFSHLDSHWNPGGCIMSVHDSDLADAWITENYDHEFLVRLREMKIGGPIASMLSIGSVALVIFGTMSAFLLDTANVLAEFSGFPIIVRPLEEDPSPRFRNDESRSMGSAVPTESEGGSNAQKESLAQSGSRIHKTDKRAGGTGENSGKRRADDDSDNRDSDNEDSTPPSPPPSLPSSSRIQGVTAKEIIHRTDVTLSLMNAQRHDEDNFLRVITKVKFYPVPNTKDQSDNQAAGEMVDEPSIEGHIDLETRSSESIEIDGAAGSTGFLANDRNYLYTEYLLPLGYSEPRYKLKLITGTQRSKTLSGTVGLAGGKPTAVVTPMAGKLTSSTTEVADEEVSEQWLVSPQRIDSNWESKTACYRGLNARIHRRDLEGYQMPANARAFDIKTRYGMAVEVAESIGTETPRVSFIYRHQIHCWVAVESKARVRGMIVLSAHYIPDIHIKKALRISQRPVLDLVQQNIGTGFRGGDPDAPKADNVDAMASERTSDDCFVFGTSTVKVPRPKPKLLTAEWFKVEFPSKGSNSSEQGTRVPISKLVSHGWSRRSVGWDHTRLKWYHPVWPELDFNLDRSSDNSTMKWILDWKDEDETVEAPGVTVKDKGKGSN